MESWKCLVLFIACFAVLSITSAAIIGEYQCLPPDDATNLGKFSIILKENGAITLGTTVYYLVDTDLSLCGPGVVITDITGTVTEKTLKFTAVMPLSTDTQVCGLTGVGPYRFDFVTRSLTEGYATEDRRFQITCTTFDPASVVLTAPSYTASGTVTSDMGTLIAPDGMDLIISSRVPPVTAWTTPPAALVSMGDKLRIEVTLDTTLTTVKMFRVTKCEFAQTTSDIVPVTRKATILGVITGTTNVCAKKDGFALGLPRLTRPFEYVTGATTVTGTSIEFDAFTFFRTADGAVPPMILSCDVLYCAAGCATDSDCTGNTGTRKRRSVESNTGNSNNTRLFATFMVTSDPNKRTKDAAAGAGTSESTGTLGNLGYVIGMVVMASLLVFSVAVTVFMFTRMKRPKDSFPKA